MHLEQANLERLQDCNIECDMGPESDTAHQRCKHVILCEDISRYMYDGGNRDYPNYKESKSVIAEQEASYRQLLPGQNAGMGGRNPLKWIS